MSKSAPCELIGYHGCNADSVKSILNNNFFIPEPGDLWLGPAVYFYAECSVYRSEDHAKFWAIRCGRIKGHHKLKYEEYSVLKVHILSSNSLDMTRDEGREMFQRTLEWLRLRRLPVRNEYEHQVVIDFMVSEFDFDVVIADVYSRFDFEIVNNVRSLIPNSRIISVYKPHSSIDTNRIMVLSTGPVTQPTPL